MNIIIEDHQYKTTVLFIHGYNKTGSQWNTTEYGKYIGIEEHIRKTRNTILISLKNYQRPIIEVSREIYESIKHFKKIICVCHSYGALYATSMAITYPTLFTTLIMLDPTIKTDYYFNYLNTLPATEVNNYKIKHFDTLPNYLDIPKHIILIIHLNLDQSPNEWDKMLKLDQIIKNHVKSRLIVHMNIGHMIHYKIPHVIIDSIKSY